MKNLKKYSIMTTMVIMGIFLFSCEKEKDDNPDLNPGPTVNLINDEFPEAEQEVMETMGAITQSIIDGDMDKLISFHAYGPKFTEFKNGAPRNGGEENEAYERDLFGSVTEVVKMDAKDMKIAVYGDVANVTFHSDFQLKFGEDLAVVSNQITLLLVKTADGWKIVHEHHSPLNQEPS